jgi:poly(3-hydroxybutyrate) depolymerase
LRFRAVLHERHLIIAMISAAYVLGLATAVASHQLQARDTPGCGKTHDDHDGTFSRSINSGGIQRNCSIHLPPKYSPEDNHPVILGFHGSSSIGAFFEADTRFSDAADKTMNSVIMVYPDGLGGAWAGASYSEATVPQDLQFVSDILDDLRDEYCVDNDRIFATGMSIGGGFVNTIACNETVGGQFAGFAPVAGAYYTDNDENYEKCKPTEGTYLLELHGLKDESVPYEGGKASGGEVPDVHDW